MKLLVVSDIHAMSKDLLELKAYAGASGGIWRVEDRVIVSNPVLAIAHTLRDQSGKIDAMLCLGDLAHQGKRLPLMIAWQDLQHVAADLNIPKVIGVVGNHDIISRANNSSDIEDLKEFIQLLRPSYPTADRDFNAQYFADGVASFETPTCLLVALNTCRTHGLGLDKNITQEEFERGVLTDAMIDKVLRAVAESKLDQVILAMHHHPIAVGRESAVEQPIPKGDVLLDQLEALGKNILVLHGHQHNVRLYRRTGNPKSPLLLSCASLCALPYPGQITDFSNQFHLIDYDTTGQPQPTGVIHSWDWSAQSWEKSARQHMPHEVHFGPQVETSTLADALRKLPRKPYYSRSDLHAAIPTMKYFSLRDTSSLNSLLAPAGLRLIAEGGRIAGLIVEEDAT